MPLPSNYENVELELNKSKAFVNLHKVSFIELCFCEGSVVNICLSLCQYEFLRPMLLLILWIWLMLVLKKKNYFQYPNIFYWNISSILVFILLFKRRKLWFRDWSTSQSTERPYWRIRSWNSESCRLIRQVKSQLDT